MGKKATILLTRILFCIITIIFAGLSVIGHLAGRIPPDEHWFMAMVALGLTPILIVNFVIFVIWIFRRSFWILVPIAAIVINIGYITAMFRLDFRSEEDIPVSQVKVASYNIQGYVHKNFKRTLEGVLEYFDDNKVDIVCFQEFYKDSTTNLVSDSISGYYPYSVVMSLEHKAMQLAIYSKFPIIDSQQINFENSSNSAMIADVEYADRILRVINVHFQTTEISQSTTEISRVKDLGVENLEGQEAFDIVMERMQNNAIQRVRQSEIIKQKIADSSDKLIILCGDFNDTPASCTYNNLVGEQLIDGFKSGGKGYMYTYNALYKLFRLDYILHSKEFKCIKYYSHQRPLSDHNPVIAEMVFEYSQ